jgi:hypothetical protein
LVDVVICHFHAVELIFDQDHQFKTVKPVGSKIVREARFISYTSDIDAQMDRNGVRTSLATKTSPVAAVI